MDTATPVFLHGYSGDGGALSEFAAACFPDKQPVCIDLPGFGASPIHDKAAETDPAMYIEEVWRVVRSAVPEGKIHLVGHSYGAVLAFALASKHPEVVERVDLFTPGVYPRFMSKIGLFFASLCNKIPGGLVPFTWVLRRKVFVDAVTKSMESKSWSEDRKQQIYAMRRQESSTYSPQMFRLSLHALRMPAALDSIQCGVPVRIVYATDDTVTLEKSSEWLKQRSETVSITSTYGGHLGLLADPERWALEMYGPTREAPAPGDGDK